MFRKVALLSILALVGCSKFQDDFTFPANEASTASLVSEGVDAGSLTLGKEYTLTLSLVCKYVLKSTKVFVGANLQGTLLDANRNPVDANTGIAISSEKMVFYFTPSVAGNNQILQLDVKQNGVSFKTVTYTYSVSTAKFRVVDYSHFDTRSMLRNSSDTLNYLIINLSSVAQKVQLKLDKMEGTSISLIDTSNASSHVTNTNNTARIHTNSAVIEGVTHKPNPQELAMLKELGYLGGSTGARMDGEITADLMVMQSKIPIYSALTTGVTKTTFIATSALGAEESVSTSVNVTEETFSLDEVSNKIVEPPFVLQENNELTYTFSTNDETTQNNVNFSLSYTTNAPNIKLYYKEGNLYKEFAPNYKLSLDTKITRDQNGLPIINKWNEELGVKNKVTGILPTKASITNSLFYTFIGEGTASVTLTLISEQGKPKEQTIILTPKTTTPDWSSMQFTKKIGLSENGFGNGLVLNKFNINVIDANQYAKYDVKIQKNFLNGSSGIWDLQNGGIRRNTGIYLNWSINNNPMLLNLGNIDNSNLSSLVGKYEVVTTFKRNYSDALGVSEYVRRDTLEIWDDRLTYGLYQYGTTNPASQTNTLQSTNKDVLLQNVNVSEPNARAYENYQVKFSANGATDTALLHPVIPVLVNGSLVRKAVNWDTYYTFADNDVVTSNSFNVGWTSTTFANKGDRVVSGIQVTIQNTSSGATNTKDIGVINTIYQKAVLSSVSANTTTNKLANNNVQDIINGLTSVGTQNSTQKLVVTINGIDVTPANNVWGGGTFGFTGFVLGTRVYNSSLRTYSGTMYETSRQLSSLTCSYGYTKSSNYDIYYTTPTYTIGGVIASGIYNPVIIIKDNFNNIVYSGTLSISFPYWEMNTVTTYTNTSSTAYCQVYVAPKDNPCFLKGTKITLASGGSVNIEEVKIGDKVIGRDGSVNVVRVLSKTPANQDFYGFNGGKVFATGGHPFLLKNGKWGVFDLAHVKESEIDTHKDLDLVQIQIGDVLYDGTEVKSITKEKQSTYKYNLDVDGNNSYTANGYVVHNSSLAMYE